MRNSTALKSPPFCHCASLRQSFGTSAPRANAPVFKYVFLKMKQPLRSNAQTKNEWWYCIPIYLFWTSLVKGSFTVGSDLRHFFFELHAMHLNCNMWLQGPTVKHFECALYSCKKSGARSLCCLSVTSRQFAMRLGGDFPNLFDASWLLFRVKCQHFSNM